MALVTCPECGAEWYDDELVEAPSDQEEQARVDGKEVLRKLVLEMESVVELCGPGLDVVACNVKFSLAEFQQLRRMVEAD